MLAIVEITALQQLQFTSFKVHFCEFVPSHAQLCIITKVLMVNGIFSSHILFMSLDRWAKWSLQEDPGLIRVRGAPIQWFGIHLQLVVTVHVESSAQNG